MSTTKITDLPQEIIDTIVDELAIDAYWYESLGGNCYKKLAAERFSYFDIFSFKHYSLISRKFTTRVQKHIFSVINIYDDNSAQELSMILERNPQLRYAIKYIDVDEETLFNPIFLNVLDKTHMPISLNVSAQPRTSEHMYNIISPADGSHRGLRTVDTLLISCRNVSPSIIRYFSDIKTLHLCHVRFNTPLVSLDDGSVFQLINLTTLVIISVTEYPVPKELITGCKNLETLVVESSKLDTQAPGPEVRLPKITQLEMGITHAPVITNLVDLSLLRIFRDQSYFFQHNGYYKGAPDLAQVYQQARDILRATGDTLESLDICSMATSCMDGRVHKFDLAGMTRLTSVTMDFNLDFIDKSDTPAVYIRDTIHTLRPRSIEQGRISIRVRICGDKDDQLMAKVMQDGKWVDVLQELIRLSQNGSAVLTVELESKEMWKVVDTWCLSNFYSFPNTDKVSVILEA